MNDYKGFLSKLKSNLEKNIQDPNIKSVYIGGSIARNDYNSNVSDVDIYIVLQHENDQTKNRIQKYIDITASEYLYDLLLWCPDGVTVAYTNYDDLIKGTSWLGYGADYYSFKENSILIYGFDIRGILYEPTEKVIKDNALYILSQLKTMVMQDVPDSAINKYFIRGVFGAGFNSMFAWLSLHNKYLRSKKKLVETICMFDDKIGKIAIEIYRYWEMFESDKLTNKDIQSLIAQTRALVNVCNEQ